MGLDALLADLERRPVVTPVTPRSPDEVTPKALNINAVTPVTPVTPQNDNAERNSDTAPHGRYLIALPDGSRFSSSFSAPATLAEVRAWHPGALSIEVEPDPAPEFAAAILEPDAYHLEVPA